MLKKLVICGAALVMGLMVSFSSIAAEAKYTEGVNYQIRGDKLTKTKEIREFFSFWCSHCFSLQGDFKAIEKTFAGKAEFVPNPVYMLGGPIAVEVQRAHAIARNMGLGDIFTARLFEQMHLKGNIPATHRDIVDFMTSIGVPSAQFEKEFNSFAILGQVATYDKWANDIKIDAVPEILVNGKYLVTMESVSNIEELLDLIGYLLDLDDPK